MKSNAQRQRDWRSRHQTGFGRIREPLTMRRLFTYLMTHGGTQASILYRAVHAERDKENWQWLTDAIQENALLGFGKLAPITRIGDGTKSNPFLFQCSEDWDISRDWDAEQSTLAKAPPSLANLTNGSSESF